MAGFASMELPSSDEDDESFSTTSHAKETGDDGRDDGEAKAAPKRGRKATVWGAALGAGAAGRGVTGKRRKRAPKGLAAGLELSDSDDEGQAAATQQAAQAKHDAAAAEAAYAKAGAEEPKDALTLLREANKAKKLAGIMSSMNADSGPERVSVDVSFAKPGPLGIVFKQRRKGVGLEVFVESVTAGSTAAAEPLVVAALVLTSVQGKPVARLSMKEVIGKHIAPAGRPIRFGFAAAAGSAAAKPAALAKPICALVSAAVEKSGVIAQRGTATDTEFSKPVKLRSGMMTAAEAKAEAPPPVKKGDLSAILANLKGDKESTTAKSRRDWKEFKQEEGIGEELEVAAKDGYLDKQAFLERADWREHDEEMKAKKGPTAR